MGKELTEKESILIDMSLKKYLDLFHEEKIFKNRFPFLLKESGIEENRIEYILTELSVLNILTFKNEKGEKTIMHILNREEIHCVLKNGGITEKWLQRESKRTDLKLSKETLKELPKTKFIAWGGLIIAILLLLKELYILIQQKQ